MARPRLARARSVLPRLSTLLLAALPGLGACAIGREPVTLASDPPGAEIWVNGEDSGFATPQRISLARGRSHEVELRLPGHEVATRRIVPGGGREIIYWREMSVGTRTWNFPLFLNIHDVFAPAPKRQKLIPNRVFVRLRREADGE